MPGVGRGLLDEVENDLTNAARLIRAAGAVPAPRCRVERRHGEHLGRTPSLVLVIGENLLRGPIGDERGPGVVRLVAEVLVEGMARVVVADHIGPVALRATEMATRPAGVQPEGTTAVCQ